MPSMASVLRIRLLGRPAFEVGGVPIACPSQKAGWLVAYVMLTKARQSRTRLAALLWADAGQRHALGSLRVAITKLPAMVAATLEITRDEIGAAPKAAYELDVEEFAAACAADDVEALQRACSLYAGDLLEGADGDQAPEFSDWLLGERTRLKKLAHDAHLKLAQRLHSQGERAKAREVADAWLRRDPASEAMHKLVMTWLASSAGGDQALAQYEVYRRSRAVAYGAAPSEDMSAFAERLRRGGEAAQRESPTRITAATSFMGRNDELAELRGLVADPACRLLTIHGLGGVGKTRLATALAELEAPAFPAGVHVVALDGLESPRLFAQTLARACGLQPAGAASPLGLVASFLGDRAALLVLDNLEHLLFEEPSHPQSIPAQVGALLRDTGARVKIVATSREPLHLQEEWVYELGGLAYPSSSEANGDAQSYPAVQFFAQRARQAYVGFSLAAELPNVVRVCEALEGLPLGLELAASWVRAVPCAEIAASLQSRAAELRNRHVNRVERHHSLGAVAAYSWERLAPEQREALAGLGALVGTFSREAAEHVAQASVRALSSLSDKALLQRAGGGRWHLHEVLRQYAWEQPGATPKARATRQAAVLKRRDAYYLEFMRSARARLDGPDELGVLAEIETESANVRPAWRASAASGALDLLDGAAPAWFEYLEARSFVAEGLHAAGEWLEAARQAAKPLSIARAATRLGVFQRFAAENARALETLDAALGALEGLDAPAERCAALMARAFTLYLLGRLEDSERDAQEAIAIARTREAPALLTSALRVHGLVLAQSGRAAQGRDVMRSALEVAERLDKPSFRAAAHNNLALAENHLGNYAAAEAGYEAALAIWRESHATVNIGRAIHNLGAVATRMGDYARALERYRAALEYLRKVGDRNLIALNLMSQGDALVRLGRPDEARTVLDQALAMAERDGHMLPALDARIVLAQAAIAGGDISTAAGHLLATFDGARKHHFRNVIADAVVVGARLAATASPERRAAAIEWARAVEAMADVSVTVRRDARALVEELSRLEPAAPAGDEPRDLDRVAADARQVICEIVQ
jgi:predicted ATPase/DNA-binding SARP family transcriptional activator